MSAGRIDEAAIDLSLVHYLEQRALEIALEKADTPERRARVEGLIERRTVLMDERAAFQTEATAQRHARGEIYSAARVAALNAMGPSQAELDRDVRSLYASQPDSDGVLETHARVHFVHGLMSARLLCASGPPDIAGAMREMQRREEDFAAAWVVAIGHAGFSAELKQLQRDALRALRTSTRPMHLLTHPSSEAIDDAAARALGKAWNKLDELAQALGVAVFSDFIALPGEGEADAPPAAKVLAVVTALLGALHSPQHKLPGKRDAVLALTQVRDVLAGVAERGGRAGFEVDL